MDKDLKTVQQVKSILDRQALDQPTQRLLQSARHAALESNGRKFYLRWAPAMAVTSLLIAVFTVTLVQNANETALPAEAIEDLLVITSEDELELFEELEFYVWFDQDENA
jgi:hypothetical protein